MDTDEYNRKLKLLAAKLEEAQLARRLQLLSHLLKLGKLFKK